MQRTFLAAVTTYRKLQAYRTYASDEMFDARLQEASMNKALVTINRTGLGTVGHIRALFVCWLSKFGRRWRGISFVVTVDHHIFLLFSAELGRQFGSWPSTSPYEVVYPF